MKMKIIYIIVMVAFLSSCTESFLDEQDPNRVTTANFWKTESDLKLALAPCYWSINSIYGDLGGFGFVQSKDDVTEAYSNVSNGWIWQLPAFIETPSEDHINRWWSWHYWSIGFCNQVIQYGGAMDIDENIKSGYVAEAKFMRGFYYLILANEWGDVPVRISVAETKDSYPIAKSQQAAVYAQAVADFTDAAAVLPASRPASDAGRATKGAALAFMGRAYLYQKNWAKAEETLKNIVDHASEYGYDLADNYSDLFDAQHKNGKESVFEQQLNGKGGTDFWADLGDNMAMSSIRPMVNAPGEVGGWNILHPTQALLDSFKVEPTVDGKIDPRAETTMAWDHLDDPTYTFYQKNFHDTWGNQMFVKKFANWELTKEDGLSLKSTYPMRYADVLLMLAEAYAMQGKVSAAAPLVQRIRTRAKLADKSATMGTWSQDQMMGEIRRQRLLEFGEEGLYFFDLRRWNLLATKIANSASIYKGRYSSKHDYLPIPQFELNSNPLMTQSPAWE